MFTQKMNIINERKIYCFILFICISIGKATLFCLLSIIGGLNVLDSSFIFRGIK